MSKDNQQSIDSEAPKDHRLEAWSVAQRLNADANTGKKLYQEVETVNALTRAAKSTKPSEPGYIDCKPDFARAVYNALDSNAKKHVQLVAKDGVDLLLDVDPIAKVLDREKTVNAAIDAKPGARAAIEHDLKTNPLGAIPDSMLAKDEAAAHGTDDKNAQQIARDSARYQRISMGLPETASNEEVIARRAELLSQSAGASPEADHSASANKKSPTLELMRHGLLAYGKGQSGADTINAVRAAAADVPAGTPYLNDQPKPVSRTWDSWIREPNGTHDVNPNPNQKLIDDMKRAQSDRDASTKDGTSKPGPDAHADAKLQLSGTLVSPETAAQFNIDRQQTESGTIVRFPNGVKYTYGGTASLLEPPPGGSVEHPPTEAGQTSSSGETRVYDYKHNLVARLDAQKTLHVHTHDGEQALDAQGNIWVQPGQKVLHRPGAIDEKHCADYGIAIGMRGGTKVTRFLNGIEYDPSRNLAIVPAEFGESKTIKEYNSDGTIAKSVTRDAHGKELYTLDAHGIHVPMSDGIVSQSPAGQSKRESVDDELKQKTVIVNGNPVRIDYVQTKVLSTTTKFGGTLTFVPSK